MLKEAKKPVIAANISVLVNIAMGVLLMFPLKHRGLALAVSLGSITNFTLLMIFYRKKVGALGLRKFSISILKILLAAAGMGLALWALGQHWDLTFAPFWPRLGYCLAMIGLGLSVYLILAWLFRVEGMATVMKQLRRSRRS